MSGRIWSWQCKRQGCGAELGIVEDGRLYPRPGLPVCVERDGTVRVTCAATLSGGRLCGQRRSWTPNGRRAHESPDVVSSGRTALLGAAGW